MEQFCSKLLQSLKGTIVVTIRFKVLKAILGQWIRGSNPLTRQQWESIESDVRALLREDVDIDPETGIIFLGLWNVDWGRAADYLAKIVLTEGYKYENLV